MPPNHLCSILTSHLRPLACEEKGQMTRGQMCADPGQTPPRELQAPGTPSPGPPSFTVALLPLYERKTELCTLSRPHPELSLVTQAFRQQMKGTQ